MREFNDMVVRVFAIISVVVIIDHYTGWERIGYGLILIPIWAVPAFAVEFVRWNTTIYRIEVRGGDAYMRKIETKISLRSAMRGFPTEDAQTGLKAELIKTRAGIIERTIGYKRAWITVGGLPAFDGDRIPSEFVEMMRGREITKKREEDLSENGLAGILALFDRGIIGADEARVMAYRQMES